MKKNNLYGVIFSGLEKYLPFISVSFFILGIWLARVSGSFAAIIDRGIAAFVSGYGIIAPLAIYAILTPSLLKMWESQAGQDRRFAWFTVFWFGKLRLLACVWAAIFTAVIFGLPFYQNGSVGLLGAAAKTVQSLAWMFTHSVYFYAIYASIITVLLSLKFSRFFRFMHNWVAGIENLGKIFIPIVPFFMLAIGSYVANLPNNLRQQIGEVSAVPLSVFSILGLKINTATSRGMILAYLCGALLTGIACMIWHLGLLSAVKLHNKTFSIRAYFRNYWAKVYPLLWSTSSEALATPLNLYLVQKYYPGRNHHIRRFVVGAGSYLNINGTVICVFILAGLVAKILNIQLSLLQLLLSTPLVFLIAYGVPGIPGELLLFGGPIVLLLNLEPAISAVFLALYLGLQIGLPDSFRTGANSTDVSVSFMLLDNIYEKRFVPQEAVQEAVAIAKIPLEQEEAEAVTI